VIGDMVIWRRWRGKIIVWRRCRRNVGVEVLLPLILWWVLSLLLLVEDVNSILQLCQPHTLPIDVLSLSLGVLSGFLSSHDGLLLLSKPLYFLLDPDQLILFSLGFIFFCFIQILDFNLVEFSFTLVDLQWWRWVGVDVLVTFTGLAGAYCGGRHVRLL
jgi:hypothetical protein